MIKFRYVLFSIIFVVSVFSLFQIKFKVQNLNRELKELKAELEHEKNAIHILKAEWAYLNNPIRLQRLTEKFLDLEELKPNQIKNISNDLVVAENLKQEREGLIVKTSLNMKRNTKWRYKDRPDLKGKQ